jgi:transcriptional regulator of acetoin/glycerol metabolism
MRREQIAHVEELEKAAFGAVSARDAIIHDSWLRCMGEHKLDPAVFRVPYIHPQGRLRERVEAMDALIHVARFGLETLYRQVSGLGYVVLLTDARGVAVDFIGDATFDNHLKKAGLYSGSDWNESFAGTCGVGTCAATGEALTVHQSDHFDGTHIPLTCTAAPVFGPSGSLAAILDISALHSPESKASQFLALQLVKNYAQQIEIANLHHAYRREWIVQFSRSPEFADVTPEFVIVVDHHGMIVGVNNRARQLLIGEGRLAPGVNSALGPLRFVDVFDADLDDLPRFTRVRSTAQRGLTLRSSGATLFALAMGPADVSSPSSAAAALELSGPLSGVSGGDQALNEIVRLASRVVNAGLSLLVQGETGTGKEHFAKTLHRASLRAEKPFVAVNCAALPEQLIESELFGHEPGAFTGASSKGKRGLVLEAEGGTLFLDEIGDMPLTAQTRLLRVLAEREVLPIGRTKPIPVNVRVIAATNRDLKLAIEEGRFREDLYFRLNGAVFTLPALRTRTDFDWLLQRLLKERGGPEAAWTVTPAARLALRSHDWPGNVRELVNVVDYAIAVSGTPVIDLNDLPDQFLQTPRGVSARSDGTRGAEARLTAALEARHWNVSAAARDLGVDRSTIHRQMNRFRIVPPQKRA